MNKPILGLLLGGVLGIFDGLSALVSAPEIKSQIVGIVIGSVIKGLITGVLIGAFARKYNSLPLGIVFGLAAGLFFATIVAILQQGYYWQIMLPGGILGMIVGYATQKYGRPAAGGAGHGARDTGLSGS
jgi:membrane protease YdiL (CAAX protease family)